MDKLTDLEALFTDSPEAHNVTAEALCVAELFGTPERFEHLDATVGDFFLPEHRAILDVLRDESLDPGGVDPARMCKLIAQRCPRGPFGEPIENYIADLLVLVPLPIHTDGPLYVRKQGRKVRTKAALRRAKAIVVDTEKALGLAGLEDSDPDEAIQEALAGLEGLQSETTDTVRELSNVSAEAFQGLKEGPSERVVWTGLADVDRVLGGLRPGELCVLAGLQGHGKTTVALQVAVNVMDSGRSVLFCSLEMGSIELAERIFCNRAQVASTAVRNRRFATGELEAIERTVHAGKGHMVIDERGGASMSTVERTARRIVPRQGVDVLIVDHLQLLRSENPKASEYEKTTQATHACKALAKNIGCAVILLSQVNREAVKAGDGRPKLHHLKGSGSIEQDADTALMIWRDESKPDDRRLYVDIAKNRHGPLAQVELYVDLEYFRVRNAASRRDSRETEIV